MKQKKENKKKGQLPFAALPGLHSVVCVFVGRCACVCSRECVFYSECKSCSGFLLLLKRRHSTTNGKEEKILYEKEKSCITRRLVEERERDSGCARPHPPSPHIHAQVAVKIYLKSPNLNSAVHSGCV